MAEETAYAARMRKEAAADECITVLLDGIKLFFQGHATLKVEPVIGGTMAGGIVGHSVRFVKDHPPA